MAKKNPTEIPALFVKSKHEPYRRAGFAFNRAGVGIALDALTKAQLEALKNDPHLVVEECTFPGEDAPEQAILVGSDKQPDTFKFGELDAQLGDVVAITFAKSGKTEAEWNDAQFGDEREALLQATVDALSAEPALFQAFLDERAKAQAKAGKPAAGGKPKAKAAK